MSKRQEVIRRDFDYSLPVCIYRGSGTPLNAGVNEVVAHRANEILTGNKEGGGIHPSTHVNMAQSSNDVIPTAKAIVVHDQLEIIIEPLKVLIKELREKGEEFSSVIKMGRTGLQDAVPITLGQQLNAFASGMERSLSRLEYEKSHWNYSCLGALQSVQAWAAFRDSEAKSTNIFPMFLAMRSKPMTILLTA